MHRPGLFLFTLLFALTVLIIPTPVPVAAQADPGRIAFVSNRDGNDEIYVMNADGSGVTRLTNHPASDTTPAWSPDGTRIAFSSDRDGTTDRSSWNHEIYVMNADGSGVTRLTTIGSAFDPAWSPDGKRIAFTQFLDNPDDEFGKDFYVIQMMDADGANMTEWQVEPPPDPEYPVFWHHGGTRNPVWSPDGTRIAFVGATCITCYDVYVADANALQAVKLTPETQEDIVGLAWSPDGQNIAFASWMNEETKIYRVNASGGNPVQLTAQTSSYHPTWSPDSTRMAFDAEASDGRQEIFAMNADGTNIINLTGNNADDTNPSWSHSTGSPVPTSPEPPSGNARCFDETGYCIAGRIRSYWEENGGLPVFGLPITAQQEEIIEGQPVQAQWFERNRLELHPDNAAPYDVLLGRLGADRLAQQGYDWQSIPREAPQDGCRYFEETGRNVCGDILAAWRANGLELDGLRGFNENENLALFGLPITGLGTETTADGRQLQVQYFERARFELHPENEPPFHVQLGLLGSEVQGGN